MVRLWINVIFFIIEIRVEVIDCSVLKVICKLNY